MDNLPDSVYLFTPTIVRKAPLDNYPHIKSLSYRVRAYWKWEDDVSDFNEDIHHAAGHFFEIQRKVATINDPYQKIIIRYLLCNSRPSTCR